MSRTQLAGAAGGADWIGGANNEGLVGLVDTSGVRLDRVSGAARALTDTALPFAGLNDDNYRIIRTDRMGSLALALNNVLFSEPFEGTTISSPNRITVSATTLTQAQTSAGGLNLNSGNSTAAAAATLVTSNRRFIKLQRAPLHAKFRARLGHVANCVMELGFGAPASQTSAPNTGVYFQVTTGGVVQGVITFNGVDTTTSAITMPGGWQNNYYVFDIILDDDEVIFFIQDTTTGLIIAERRLQLPASQVRLWDVSRLGVYARQHHVTAPASAPVLILSSIDVILLDASINRPWVHSAVLNGQGSSTHPTTFAQTSNYANSAAPTSATLSNTAAGYTTLGGQFQFAAVAGSETDFALFGFTVPAPMTLVVTNISIDTFNMGAAVATTPTLLQWFASEDQTAISLATATNRRTILGAQTLSVGTAIGGKADVRIVEDFSNGPLVTNGGRIFVIGLKMPVGTATASQIVRGTVSVKGYFE